MSDTKHPEPSSPPRPEPSSDVDVLNEHLRTDPRFNPPTPSPWKRAALLLTLCLLFYLAFTMRRDLSRRTQPDVVHATRYSKEYKFRPAASPIITERLKDGRKRVRGAQPTRR